MSDLEHWEEGNERYLSAALAWLRLKLERLGAGGTQHVTIVAPQEPMPPVGISPAAPRFRDRLLRRNASSPIISAQPQPVPRSLVGADVVTDDQIAAAAAEMRAAEAIDPPPALLILSQRFGLSEFERNLLLLCAAMELDTRTASLCARAEGDASRPYPTFALALALFDDPAWDVLSPERPLRYWRLIEINQPGGQPLTTSPLRADERIVNFIKGLNYLDDRLSPMLVPFDVEESPELSQSQGAEVESIAEQLRLAAAERRLPLVQLVGPDSMSKQLVALGVASELGLRVYRMPTGLLPSGSGDLETLTRLWQRESVLLSVALFLDASDTIGAAPDGDSAIRRFLMRNNSLTFLDTRDVLSGLNRGTITADIATPSADEQAAAWASAGVDRADLLAGQFNLNLPEIVKIARLAQAESDVSVPAAERVWETCLIRTRPRLDTLAQRIDAKATWEDIVLPDEEMEMLHQIAAQVRQRSRVYDDWGFRDRMNRGLGINALFSGESGTGKTMAAEVIANDLHLNLYRIDLSAVVSKYIGETEKNLRKLFDAAEDGGAILFFDEADALFGKRSEVKDSHDRYANIEINYLLQRIEAYRGLALLATNLKSSLDAAFMRRLRFIVNFPFPGQIERRAIWERAFPAATPTTDLDMARLAKLNLTGGSIHNIAINAAFIAAESGSNVTMPVVLSAARSEYRKLDRPVNEAEFRWIEPMEAAA